MVDGDSIEVRRADGSSVEVRLIGINAPEGDECHGNAARSALEALLAGKEMTLISDDEDRDQFGRLLRYVYLDAVNANLVMAADGHALALQSGHRLEPAFVEAAVGAAAAGRGMWSPRACSDQQRIPEIEITDYVFDPAGRDADNLNDELVAFVNREDQSLDLGGWILRDESTKHRFVLPDGVRVAPDGELRIRSGCGAATPVDLYWCSADPVWSNGGDTIILQLPDGTVVAWEQFAGQF